MKARIEAIFFFCGSLQIEDADEFRFFLRMNIDDKRIGSGEAHIEAKSSSSGSSRFVIRVPEKQ